MPSKVVVHGASGETQRKKVVSADRPNLRLKEDLVIPKGTEFSCAPRSKQYASHQAVIGLHDDSCGIFIIWDELLKMRPDLFEEVNKI